MSKYRVFELAKEFHTESKVVLDILKKGNYKVANHLSSVGDEERNAIKAHFDKKAAPAAKSQPKAAPVKKEQPKQANHGEKQNNSHNNSHNHNHNNGGNGAHNNGERRTESSQNHGGNHNGGRNDRNDRNERNNRGGNNRSERNERNNRNERNERNNRGGNNRNDRNNRRNGRNNRRGGNQQQAPKVEIARPKHIKLPESIAVKDLASKMSYTAAEVVKKLFMMGVMATINQEIDFDTAALVASEFGVTCEELPPDVDPTEIPEIEDDPKSLKLRPPVVTVMGHVDHGKTSLLDCIRNTHVQTHEAGGITQHIGAYQVNCSGKKIVFLDTPGHEAFTAMRARGAQITDIAILVVAADDGVMPQTIEAINHAKSAEVPIIVAINKIDKPGANPDHVKQELMEHGLVPEEYGGDTIMVPVSAKKQMGIDDLLENVLLVAEVEELKANPNREARGVIIEAKLDKGRGTVATVLVQSGTLRIGDSIVCGTTYGKVRAMIDDRGNNVKKAGPSVPVEILGLNDVPAAGDILAVLEEKQARSIAEARVERERNQLMKSKKVSLDALFQQIQEGEIKDLNIVVKADVQGSVEALCGSLLKLNKNDEVRVSIVHSGVGAVNESDVMLASAANAIIIAFNVRPDANARKVADNEDVDIRTYRVIYDALNDVKDAMSGMLKPKYKEVVQGRVEIRQVMKFSKALVAGSYVLEGKICNNSKIRIIRDNIEVFDGEIDSLRRFKDEVKEVREGYECGISIVDFRDFKEGDIIEAYTMEEIATSIAEANKAAAEKRKAQAEAQKEMED
ncbi:translation initiation factor IF-2 [Selenomonas sp. WCT3]|uniref:translation initiation factor IF-2 n=1 Tax=Selenomonas sp. WCT3 TaxID=3158785 RepID=UPI00088A406F|nr:translation initiation factor IF-2 [Selenomonas ruminantium]